VEAQAKEDSEPGAFLTIDEVLSGALHISPSKLIDEAAAQQQKAQRAAFTASEEMKRAAAHVASNTLSDHSAATIDSKSTASRRRVHALAVKVKMPSTSGR
jgi:hypothetical protein